MSAFFVGKPTIDAVVTLAIRRPDLSGGRIANATKVGQLLWVMNAAAVAARYRDHPDLGRMIDNEAIAAYRFRARTESDPVLFKSLRCLAYQCDEGAVPAANRHFAWLETMILLGAAVGLDRSPEYDAAPWGLCATER